MACQPAPTQVSEPVGGVPTAIDGDSLRANVDGETLEIRLDGINAPETDECLAEEAATRLRQLADAGVTVEATGLDQFGRTLALVRSARDGSELLNETMVAEGLALATSGGDWSDRLIAAESDARRANRGIWSPTACGPAVEVDLRIEFSRPDPVGSDRPDDEFVTIHNFGTHTVDLAGFVLRDESSSNRLQIPDGTALLPQQSLEVWSGCRPPSGIGWCSETPVWNNAGDSALLLAPSGNVVAHTRYDPGA